MLSRIARASYHHRRLVVAVWVLLFVAAIAGGSALKGDYANSGRLPHTDSQAAYDSLARDFPQQHGDEGRIVFADIGSHRAAVDAYLAQVQRTHGVIGVQTLQFSQDGKVAIAPITTANGASAHPKDTADAIKRLAVPVQHQGVDVEFSGGWFGDQSMPASEIVGVIAAIVILLVAFGSLIAMGLPIVTALIGIAISLAGVGIIANVFTTPSFAPQVAAMIGIGVGIDYALFIVTRYRAALYRTHSPEASVVEAMNSAGRAVVFAGFTVMISVLGMFLMGLNFLHGLAVGTSLAVAIAVLAAITLLPALLGFVGFTIDRLRVGRPREREDEGMWHRWARTVQRRPAPIALAGFALLVVVALPTLSLRLGSADESNDPKSSTTHKAYELIAKGFGPGANGPILVVADTSNPGSAQALPRLVTALRSTPGVASVTDARVNPAGDAALATLIPTTGPQDRATEHLVHRLRDQVVPAATASTGMKVHVGGQTAGAIDFSDVIGSRLPIFIGGVLTLSFLLLLVVFRSVLVPLKAVLMNLLSIGAAYGVIVGIFEWGWGAGLLGVSKGPIEAWVPMMLFAIVFGLSMDYEVFLLSSVREHYDRTHDNATAVAEGLASTARVITAAALIMVFVFGSFVVSDLRALKLIGLGLAVAVAIDASVVRVVLVPATMELLGDANWWLPRWLQRVVPHVQIDDVTPDDVVTLDEEPELVGVSNN
jgi:RND superfamily putative drug exporter